MGPQYVGGGDGDGNVFVMCLWGAHVSSIFSFCFLFFPQYVSGGDDDDGGDNGDRDNSSNSGGGGVGNLETR